MLGHQDLQSSACGVEWKLVLSGDFRAVFWGDLPGGLSKKGSSKWNRLGFATGTSRQLTRSTTAATSRGTLAVALTRHQLSLGGLPRALHVVV